jgi:hypothetical protein
MKIETKTAVLKIIALNMTRILIASIVLIAMLDSLDQMMRYLYLQGARSFNRVKEA